MYGIITLVGSVGMKMVTCPSTTINESLPMDVSESRGTPKWMVYNGKPYLQMDDLGGFNPIFGNIPIVSVCRHNAV